MNMLRKVEAGGVSDRRRARERRKAERREARDAAVLVEHGRGVEAALCGDLSSGGARLSLDRPLTVGETVAVGFGAGTTLTGRVAWVHGAECGIEFEPVVASPAGLPAPQGSESPTQVAIRGSGRGFREGLNVTVMLPDRERKAILHWTTDNSASLTLRP